MNARWSAAERERPVSRRFLGSSVRDCGDLVDGPAGSVSVGPSLCAALTLGHHLHQLGTAFSRETL
jgi:hypothetical protein